MGPRNVQDHTRARTRSHLSEARRHHADAWSAQSVGARPGGQVPNPSPAPAYVTGPIRHFRRSAARAGLAGAAVRAVTPPGGPIGAVRVRTRSALLGQRARLVDRRAAGLLALDEVLRLLLGGLDLAPARLGLRGDLLLDGAHGLRAVAVPLDLVALLEFSH